jgi:hypothetical protein
VVSAGGTAPRRRSATALVQSPMNQDKPLLHREQKLLLRHSCVVQSQKDYALQLRVARHELPWEIVGKKSQSVFGKWILGSTGGPPVPSGDPPDGTGGTNRTNGDGLCAKSVAAVPVGGSPTGAGQWPALPIFKTRSQF